MELALKEKLIETPQLRKRLRQLRWFDRAFKQNSAFVAAHLNIAARVDDRRLHKTFFDWVAAIGAIEHDHTLDKADRIVFMGGLALRELLRTRPVEVLATDDGTTADDADPTARIAHAWPEGFIYTNFCICSIVAVHEQEFGEPRPLDQAAYDLRTWWSYRENASEDPDISIAFLDQFLGITPNWMFPMSRAQTGIESMAAQEKPGNVEDGADPLRHTPGS